MAEQVSAVPSSEVTADRAIPSFSQGGILGFQEDTGVKNKLNSFEKSV
ncbi:MAG: hypothetical protein GY820_40350 [Gammaproteobacteria bacterium]|nr:hypothetical protein [Gammaproteobacteria bacterium]